MTETSTSGAWGGTGYTCALCGAFVLFNTLHSCGWATAPAFPDTVYVTGSYVDLQPVINKLDELKKAIEELTELIANSD